MCCFYDRMREQSRVRGAFGGHLRRLEERASTHLGPIRSLIYSCDA